MEGQGSGTPFLVAGYLITWALLLWYVWRLSRRSADAGRAIGAAGPAPHAAEGAESDE